jgi:hypothetical protein
VLHFKFELAQLQGAKNELWKAAEISFQLISQELN